MASEGRILRKLRKEHWIPNHFKEYTTYVIRSVNIYKYFNNNNRKNLSELRFRGILNEKLIKFIRFLCQPNNSKTSSYFQI